DRNRRYESASALAADVERYLHDDPVQACPPSAWYRFRKFARRHKAALGTATSLGLVLLLAVTALALSNARISWEQEQTQKALAAETRAKEGLNEAIARERSNLCKYAVGLARRDWLACDIEQAQRNLEACPGELRDGDWRYLHRVCHAEVLQFKQVKSPGRLQYGPDGKTLANVGSGL